MNACDGFFDNLLHTGVIVSTSSTFEWPITSVLGLQMEEIRIDCDFRRKKKKKTSCTMENSGFRCKNKLYDGCKT